MILIKKTKNMGRGLFSTSIIQKGIIIHSSETIKIPKKEIINNGIMSKYVFEYNKNYNLLCLGIGSLFNHSTSPNIEAFINDLTIEFKTLRKILPNEQLFINYGFNLIR